MEPPPVSLQARAHTDCLTVADSDLAMRGGKRLVAVWLMIKANGGIVTNIAQHIHVHLYGSCKSVMKLEATKGVGKVTGMALLRCCCH